MAMGLGSESEVQLFPCHWRYYQMQRFNSHTDKMCIIIKPPSTHGFHLSSILVISIQFINIA